jgi:hypothetical protein
MRPTRIGTLVALMVGVGAISWGVLQILEHRGSSLPNLAWTAPAAIALLAVAVLVAALALRSRLQGRHRPPNPLGTARMAVLGKASAHVGPIVGGLYAGYLVVLLPGLDVSSRRERAVICAAALVASVFLSAAGLFLERTCRVRGGEDEEEPPAVSA